MKKSEQCRIGFYIVLINIILILFMFTSKQFDNVYFIISIASSIIAIIINFQVMLLYKNIFNIITFIINILISNGLIIYFIFFK
ncbi:MAG: hypothetical protein IKP76_04050 [Bacilli bacterium]|nr:hypothetical protein [Bacilli bacterium]